MLEIPLILSKKPGAAMRKGTETLNTASIIQSILKRISNACADGHRAGRELKILVRHEDF
jgi:hypothetical protein